ncbi:MAG: Blue-light-activated protein [Syntrophaceae bacterium PtaU1.Bin231]|nr:MAG: Blue-light-activated protein [Syntrophaceae bacterium PtaU1.Bin231]
MDKEKTREQLLEEIAELRRHIELLEKGPAAETAATVGSDDYYRFATEHANDGVVIMSGETRLYFNRKYMELLGYDDPDVLTALPAYVHVHPDDVGTVREHARRRQRGEPVPRQYEARLIRKNGDVVHVEISSSLITYQGQNASLGYVRDITARKRAEEALLRSEDMYRNLAETASDVILTTDLDGVITYINRAGREFSGGRDVVGMAMQDFLSRETVPAHLAMLEARRGGLAGMLSYEWQIVSPRDGSIVQMDIRSSLLMDKGSPSGILVIARDVTERKRTDEAVARSEKRYRDFIDFLPLPVCEFDAKGRITLANRSGFETFGYSQEDYNGESNILQLVAPQDRHKVAVNIERLIRGEKLGSTDYTLIKKDGTQFPAIVFSSLDTKGNTFARLRTVIIDITDQKKAAEALREIEERFRLINDNLQDTIWMMDMDLNYTYMGPYVKQVLGYEPEEYVTKPLQDIMTPASFDLCIKLLAEELEVENRRDKDLYRTRTIEVEHIAKDGRIVWVDIKLTFIRDADGNAVGILGLSRDIMERKLAENALRASEEKYRTLTNNIPDLIYSLDNRGHIVTVNENVLHRYGYGSADVLGKPFIDFIHPEDREQVMAAYHAVIAERREFFRGLQFRGMAKDGTPYWFELNNRVTFNEEGRYVKEDGVLRDITARKDAELDRAILEERLQRAEKMEALGTMAGGVAHDLNNVLGVVVGYAEMLLDEATEESPFREHAENIMKGGERAAAIVQDLLTLARRGVKTGKVVNLNSIVMDYQMSPEFYKLRSSSPKIQITTDLEGGLPNIKGSPVHLAKTIMNLFTNAMEAMPEGGLLTVRTSNRYLDRPIQGYDHVREGNYAVLSVSDTGIGIPAADLKRIFEPFYTKKVMGRSGTGLGLSVVWGTVKDHDGYIDVESQIGRGTTLTLYFPVTAEDVSEQETILPVSSYMGNGETILVVDDVEGQRDLAVRMLTKLNYRVAAVASGEEAVAYMFGHQADLVVLDMIMDPGIDGMEAYRRIQAIHPRQKAIIVSGYADMDRVDELQALGVGAYVRKPYIMEKLGLAVRTELDK